MKTLISTILCAFAYIYSACAAPASPRSTATPLPPGDYLVTQGTVLSVPLTPSPDGTTIPPSTQIIDNTLATWTVVNGVVQVNGANAGFSSNVVLLSWIKGVIWQKNFAGNSWYWDGTTWQSGTPSPSPSPSPSPTPTPAPTPSPTPTPPTGAGKPGLKLWGGVSTIGTASGYNNPPVAVPDTLWKPMNQGAATGNQYPVNWYRDSDLGPIGYVNFSRSYWQSCMKKASDWCHANGINGICSGLWYPGHVPGSWGSGQTIINNFILYLQDTAPYVVSGTYLIAANEVLSNNGSAMSTDPLLSALGGKGSSGWDGLIALIKLERQYLPAGVLLGLNDYNVCDYSSGVGFWNAAACVSAHQACANNGAKLDWHGVEGYWFNSQGEPAGAGTGIQGYINQFNSVGNQLAPLMSGASGPAFIAVSEFTPDPCAYGNGCASIYPNQQAAWTALLNAFAANKYIFGVSGPWQSHRLSMAWSTGTWFYNDTGSAATHLPDKVPVAAGAITPSLTWLQQWVATNVHP